MTREERREAAKARKAAAAARLNKKPAAPGDLPSSSEEDDDDDDDGDDDMPANPNHTAKAAKQATATPAAADTDADGAPKRVVKKAGDNLSRREREALQAQQAKERYMKLHAEGKTVSSDFPRGVWRHVYLELTCVIKDEAKADLARLRLVRERRDEEAARKKAEAEEKAAHEASKSEQLEREERMRERAGLKKNLKGKGKKGAA